MGGFFVLGKGPLQTKYKFRNEYIRWADLRLLASHVKNNAAKMPTETLLQRIGNGVFYLAQMEDK